MAQRPDKDVTELLAAWRGGSDEALQELIPLVYRELRHIARKRLGGERPDHSLQPTELAHEAFLRLTGYRRVSWQGRTHFFAVAARIMRRVLVDHARSKAREKRGGNLTIVPLDQTAERESDVDLVALDEALGRLARKDPRQCEVVELRYFGGLTVEETSEVLGASPATVKRDWSVARLWLRRELERNLAS